MIFNGAVRVTGNIGIGANNDFALSGVTTTNASITLVSGGTIWQSMSGVISDAPIGTILTPSRSVTIAGGATLRGDLIARNQ